MGGPEEHKDRSSQAYSGGRPAGSSAQGHKKNYVRVQLCIPESMRTWKSSFTSPIDVIGLRSEHRTRTEVRPGAGCAEAVGEAPPGVMVSSDAAPVLSNGGARRAG